MYGDTFDKGDPILNKYEALIALREVYTSPLLDLVLKAKLKEIIKVLESTV